MYNTKTAVRKVQLGRIKIILHNWESAYLIDKKQKLTAKGGEQHWILILNGKAKSPMS